MKMKNMDKDMKQISKNDKSQSKKSEIAHLKRENVFKYHVYMDLNCQI